MAIISRGAGLQAPTSRWSIPAALLAVPFLWPPTGVALTELPALLAFTAFILIILLLLRMPEAMSATAFAWAALGGTAWGIAILGRQTYLIILPAMCALFFLSRRKWALWAVCFFACAMTCGWLFVVWRGTVPPAFAHIGSGIRLDHGVLSLCYIAAASLFLNPQSLRVRNIQGAIGCGLVGVPLALLTRDYSAPPAKSLLIGIFGPHRGLVVGAVIGAFMGWAAAVWLWNSIQAFWRDRSDTPRVFLYLVLFALAAAPAKVTHLFSSRYVVGLLTVLALLAAPAASPWLLARLILGALCGAAMLLTYFH